jgi:photosystem I P700 chlorophyll a apoprotein A2
VFESDLSLGASFSLTAQVFTSHWAHLSIIFLWASGIVFHIGWCGNYDLWLEDPIGFLPIGHASWDPNFTNLENLGSGTVVLENSGLYHWLYTIGYKDSASLFKLVLFLELLSLSCLSLSVISCITIESMLNALGRLGHASMLGSNIFGTVKSGLTFSYVVAALFMSRLVRVPFHRANLLGFSSLLWSGHLAHCSIPVSRGYNPQLILDPSELRYLSYKLDAFNQVLGSEQGAGSSLLSFILGFRPDTASIYMSDVCHHHLALGCLLIWSKP